MTILLVCLTVLNLVFLVVLFTRTFDKERSQERSERLVREEISRNREELLKNLTVFNESLGKELSGLTQNNETKLEKVREVLEKSLRLLQEDNSKKLEQMRATVDEKLHSTLERRLGESFRVVSDRLEQVHKGLGEMQTLASGVGDLKKVLTNVKTRGTWGEIQLGNLLEQILTPEQFERNFPTKKGSREPVEFAIKLPGKGDEPVYIPIDAKFPKEDYERLLKAQDESNLIEIEESAKAIENRIKLEARKIKEKYIDPPHTTDFGILYLPIEGLYAEVLRRPGLWDLLQRDFRVTVTGPTTISALLNALQMGFHTIAVEKRASEVWVLLGKVKNEFGKFGDILNKTQEKLKQASDNIELAQKKSRTIESKLKNVQLPQSEKPELLEDDILNIAHETINDETIV